MHFDQRMVGEYRIYAGAMEARRGDGFTAAVVVERQIPGSPRSREVMRDDRLACGHRWELACDALNYAMARGLEKIAPQAVAA